VAPIWGPTTDAVLDNFAQFLARLGGQAVPRPGRKAIVEATASGVVLINARVLFPGAFLDVRAVVTADADVVEYSFHVQQGAQRLAGFHLDAIHGCHTHDPADWSIRQSSEHATFDFIVGLVRGLLGIQEPET
jgi:hypothetical protein